MKIPTILTALLLLASVNASPAAEVGERLRAILAQRPVADSHADTVLQVFPNGVDLGIDLAGRQTDLPKLKAGGVGIQMFSIFTDPDNGSEVVQRTHKLLDIMKTQIARHPDLVELATTSADIQRIHDAGKIVALISIEGGHGIGDRLDQLDVFYKLGVRSMTLTWMHDNAFADSSTDSPRWGGLSPLGVKVVKRMNELGMVVDVSHTADSTVRAVLKVSKAPIIASHSSCYALFNHPRNLKDDLIRAIAAKGGVVAINFFPNYVDGQFYRSNLGLEGRLNQQRKDLYARYHDNVKAFNAAWAPIYAAAMRSAHHPVTIARLVDHIDHAVKVAGIDHVGLGSDFDGVAVSIKGLEDASRYGNLVRELIRRGYKDEDILKILGGNERRLYEQVLANAK